MESARALRPELVEEPHASGSWTGSTRIAIFRLMAREKSLFEESDPTAEAAADARAEADVAAGRLIGHGAVRRWLASWGSGARLPRPRVGD